MLELPPPVALRDSPFMVARHRYTMELDLPLDLGLAYSLYLRVITPAGLPVTEEEALRFRVPRPPAPEKPPAR